MKHSLKKLFSLLICVFLVISAVTAVSAAETATEAAETTSTETTEEISWNYLASATDWDTWFSGSKNSKLLTDYADTGTTAYFKLTESFEISCTGMYYIGVNGSSTCNVVLDLGGYTLTVGGSHTGRVFGIYTKSSLTIQNGTLVNEVQSVGVHGGLLFLNSGTMTLQNLTLTDNSTAAFNCNGKLISVGSSSTLNMTDVDITANTENSIYNTAKGYGHGGILTSSGTLTMTRCNLTASNTTSAADSESRIRYGGIAHISGGTATMTDCTFTGGVAAYGGALGVAGGSATLNNCAFSGGNGAYGGGISVLGGTAVLNDSTFTGCTATYGGAADVEDAGVLTMNDCTISNTSGVTRGGAVFVYKGTAEVSATLNNCTITECSSKNGGGVAVYGKGTAKISGGSITGCTATTGNGGGIYMYNAGYTSDNPVLTVENATIADCTSACGGGNVYVANKTDYMTCELTLNNTVLSGGTVTGEGEFGGNLYMAGVDYTATDGTVYRSTTTVNGGRIENGTAVSWGGNLGLAGHSTLNLNDGVVVTGGKVTNSSNCGGGNLYIGNPKVQVTLNDGTISNGESARYGGNIRVGSGAFIMNGGLIEGGTAANAGNSVFVNASENAKLLVYGGTIRHTLTEDVLVCQSNGTLGLYNGTVEGFDPTAFVSDCSEIAAEEGTQTYIITHKDIEGVTVRDTTCDQAGTKTTDCATCAHVYTYPVAAGHTLVVIPAVPATCAETGLTEGSYCMFCDGASVDQEVLPALGHTYDAGVYTEPTAEADGYTTYTCTVCSHSYTVVDEGSKEIHAIITVQPADAAADSGTTATFSVVAVNGVSYQWQYRRGENGIWYKTTMPGNDTDTLTVNVTAARNGYQYRCVVVGYDDVPVESEPATLTAYTSLTVTNQPDDQIVVSGFEGQFSVEAEGEILRYQWQYSFPDSEDWLEVTEEGATGSTLTLTATQERDGYQYRCIITDAAGNSVISETAAMHILSFTVQPQTQDAVLGTEVQFSVETTVSAGFQYQWQYRRSESDVWSNSTMDGYNTAVLTVPVVAARSGYQYRCVITGARNSTLASDAATLNLGEAPVIVTEPADQKVLWNTQAQFSVTATNVYTYQWQYRRSETSSWFNTAMSGFDTDTLTVEAINSRDGYQYRCRIVGLNGDVIYTQTVTLTLGTEEPLEPVAIVAQPSSLYGSVGETVIFVVEAEGEQLQYQWQFRKSEAEEWTDSALDGFDTEMLFVDVTKARNGYQFRCIVTDAAGNEAVTETAILYVD